VSGSLPVPRTQYVESDGLSIAYQVFGGGSHDLIVVPPILSHLELNWEYAAYAQMLRRLAQTFRVIMFDKRGQGMSDRFEGAPTLEQRMDDMRDVMGAAGSQRAVLFAASEGGPMAALFTATFPEKVERLVLYASMARFTQAPDYPWRRSLEETLQWTAAYWGTAEAVRLWAPDRASDPAYCDLAARYQRQSASPSAMKRMMIANDQIDVRSILPQVRRPTLVVHRRGDRAVTYPNGRYLAERIPDAVYLELPGNSHFAPEGDSDAIVDAVVQFATARRSVASAAAERWLATVLFTDIVDSTALATRLGDRAWVELQRQFLAIGRSSLEAHRGREIDTAGDGLFATFDGPARAIRSAAAMVSAAKSIGLELRAGLHTGEVETNGAKVSGAAVHIGARVMALATGGEVLVSSTVKDLVAGSGIAFESRGAFPLKGLRGEWQVHRALVD
jgi:pimeloyl-ACP methyl ester carboxylesterase